MAQTNEVVLQRLLEIQDSLNILKDREHEFLAASLENYKTLQEGRKAREQIQVDVKELVKCLSAGTEYIIPQTADINMLKTVQR